MATYPLADDGQRPFVDIGSLPLGIVDRVEVLKDGASAIYGSDAIAGVVNIITKKDFTGLDLSANLGSSSKADGFEQRLSATYGFGNLSADGHNVYFNVEYRHQAEIKQEDRGSYLNQLDLRPYGGNDLRGGIVQQAPPNNGTYTAVGQVAPLDRTAATPQLDQFYLLPGCAPQNLNYSGGCTWDPNLYKKIQPRSEGLNFTAKWTQQLGDRWTEQLGGLVFPVRVRAMAPAESISGRHVDGAVHLGRRQRHTGGSDRPGDHADRAARESSRQSVQSGKSLLCGSSGVLRCRLCQLHRKTRTILRCPHRHTRPNHQIPDRCDPAWWKI